MGGGDLNLKKSWHPLTMRNQERVWKEEQRALEEERKLEQLKKELNEERAKQELQELQEKAGLVKKSNRVDWLYAVPVGAGASNQNDLEEYLLGHKRADKLLISENSTDTSHKFLDSIGLSNTNANSQRDLLSKIREDPLFYIKKREQEMVQGIVNNPLELKKIEGKLKKQDKKKDKKKDGKDKKPRARSRSNSTERRHRPSSPPVHRNRSRSPSSSRASYKHYSNSERSRSRDIHRRHRSRTPPRPRRNYSGDRNDDNGKDNSYVRRARSPMEERRDYRRTYSRPISREREGRHYSSSSSHHYSRRQDRRDDHASTSEKSNQSKHLESRVAHPAISGTGPSEEEKERLRQQKIQEMMQSAQELDVQRTLQRERTQQLIQQEQEELHQTFQATNSFSSQFYSMQKNKGVHSVADSIARNRFYLRNERQDA